MKKCIVSALAGALGMFLFFYGIAFFRTAKETAENEYEHIDFVTEITQEECYICGGSDPLLNSYWGEDNVGIVNLNTFELLHLEINRYDDGGHLIEKAAGYMQSNGMSYENSYVYAWTHPDRGYANVQITGTKYAIDRDEVQNHLCQICLDSINELWFGDDAPAEYAIVSFAERTIRPLVPCYTWFGAGDYGINCEFKENGSIDLLIHYCPNRYK